MVDAGLMERAELNSIAETQRRGRWSVPARRPTNHAMPPDFESCLERNRKAASFFASLAPSHQRQYMGWIASAKREETHERRVKEALKLLIAGEKLGMR